MAKEDRYDLRGERYVLGKQPQGSDYFTSPIDTHCLLMSVFNEIAPDTQNTNRMKQWLLNQKRTQKLGIRTRHGKRHLRLATHR